MHIALSLFRFLLSVLSFQSSGQAPRRQLSAKVRRIKQRRLEELEAQAAAYGPKTPPEISTEIDDLRIELEIVDSLERSKLDPPMQELLGRYDTGDQIIAFSRGLASKIRQLEQGLYELVDSFEQWKAKREEQDSQRAQREQRERSIGSLIMGIMIAMLAIVLVLLIILLSKGLT